MRTLEVHLDRNLACPKVGEEERCDFLGQRHLYLQRVGLGHC